MAWSAWQDGFEFTAPSWWVNASGSPTHARSVVAVLMQPSHGGDFGGYYADLAAAIADIPALLAEAVTPSSTYVDQSSTGAICDQEFQANSDVAEDVETDPLADVTIGQTVATFTDAGVTDEDLPEPPLPSGVTVYEYESDAATRLSWDDWALTEADDGYQRESVQLAGQKAPPFDNTVFYDDWVPYMSWRMVDPDLLSFPQMQGDRVAGQYPVATCWPTPGMGTELSRIAVTLSLSDTVVTTDATIDMSGVGDLETFTLLIQPSSMIEGAPTMHAPTTGVDDTFRSSEASDLTGATVSFTPRPPLVRYVTPRWRYELSDAVYTVGGHWATPSGVQLMSLKGDGVTWIPVVDGLAPPLL